MVMCRSTSLSVLSRSGGDEAVQNINFTHKFTHNERKVVRIFGLHHWCHIHGKHDNLLLFSEVFSVQKVTFADSV